jgi:hypothetical protein
VDNTFLCLDCATQAHFHLGHTVVYAGNLPFQCASRLLPRLPFTTDDALSAFFGLAELQPPDSPPFRLFRGATTPASDFSVARPDLLTPRGTVRLVAKGRCSEPQLAEWMKRSPLRRAASAGGFLFLAGYRALHRFRGDRSDSLRLPLPTCPLGLFPGDAQIAAVSLKSVYFVSIDPFAFKIDYCSGNSPISAGWTRDGEPLVLEEQALVFLGQGTSFSGRTGFTSFCIVPRGGDSGALLGQLDGRILALSWDRDYSFTALVVDLGNQRPAVVSYCPDSGIAFASAASLCIGTPGDFFANGPFVNIDVPGPLFCACADGPVHFFQSLTNAVIAVDLARGRVSPLDEGACLGVVRHGAVLLAGPRPRRGACARAIAVRDVRVPPSFWSATSVNPDGVTVDEMDACLSREFTINAPCPCIVRSPSFCPIVGIRIVSSVKRGKIWCVCRNRRFQLGGGDVCIPLAPDEAGQTQLLRFEGEERFGFRLLVHCASNTEITAVEIPRPRLRTPRAEALAKIRRAIVYNDGEAIDVSLAVLLIGEWLYVDREVGPSAREILGGFRDDETTQELWVSGMQDALQNHTVPPELVPDVWRDFNALSPTSRASIEDLVWEKLQGNGLRAPALVATFL